MSQSDGSRFIASARLAGSAMVLCDGTECVSRKCTGWLARRREWAAAWRKATGGRPLQPVRGRARAGRLRKLDIPDELANTLAKTKKTAPRKTPRRRRFLLDRVELIDDCSVCKISPRAFHQMDWSGGFLEMTKVDCHTSFSEFSLGLSGADPLRPRKSFGPSNGGPALGRCRSLESLPRRSSNADLSFLRISSDDGLIPTSSYYCRWLNFREFWQQKWGRKLAG